MGGCLSECLCWGVYLCVCVSVCVSGVCVSVLDCVCVSVLGCVSVCVCVWRAPPGREEESDGRGKP